MQIGTVEIDSTVYPSLSRGSYGGYDGRMASPGITPFGVYLTELLAARDLSLRGFALLVEVDASSVMYAKRARLAVHRIGPWAEALGLVGRERERFEYLALRAHGPLVILEHLRHLDAAAVAPSPARESLPRRSH